MTTTEFNTQVQQLTKYLRPFAMKLTHNSENASDLIQETMLKAISNREKFSDGTNLKAWLYTIMKNTFITDYHKAVRRNTWVDTTENLHFINSSRNAETNSASGEFIMKDIRTAIEKVKEEYSEPFMMYFRGWKYHEIAEKLMIPIGTVKNRIHIASKMIKDQLPAYAFSN